MITVFNQDLNHKRSGSMLETTKVRITNHCIARYRQRIGPAKRSEILLQIRNSKIPGAGVRSKAHKVYQQLKSRPMVLRGNVLMLCYYKALSKGEDSTKPHPQIIFLGKFKKAGLFVAITCWKLN